MINLTLDLATGWAKAWTQTFHTKRILSILRRVVFVKFIVQSLTTWTCHLAHSQYHNQDHNQYHQTLIISQLASSITISNCPLL